MPIQHTDDEPLEGKTEIMPVINNNDEVITPSSDEVTGEPKVIYSVENTSKKLKKEGRKKRKNKKSKPQLKEEQTSDFGNDKTVFIDTRGIDVPTVPEITSQEQSPSNLSSDENKKEDATSEVSVGSAGQTEEDRFRVLSKRAMCGTVIAIISVVLLVLTCMFGGPLLYAKGYTNGVKDGKDITSSQNAQTKSQSNTSNSDKDKSETNQLLSSDQTNQECKHQWQDVSEVVHHDAVTHEVNHPAEYEQKTVTHTVCNICGSKIDNIIDQHKKETGHYSWTSDVPFQENVMTKGEYTETVVDKEAYDEVVVKNQICNICGETRSKAEE